MELKEAPFVLFGTSHLLTILVVFTVAVGLPLWARRSLGERGVHRLGISLAGFLVAHELYKGWLFQERTGASWRELLPLHLCGIAIWMVALALIGKRFRLYEVVYFWGLGGTLQAVLTPDLPVSYPDPAYLAFFVSHGGIILAILYMTLAYRWRPTWASLGRSMGALVAFALVVGPINALLDTNYLFLCHKPAGESLMDFLGPWPWYLLSLFFLGLLLFTLCYLPFAWMDWRRAREAGGGVRQ